MIFKSDFHLYELVFRRHMLFADMTNQWIPHCNACESPATWFAGNIISIFEASHNGSLESQHSVRLFPTADHLPVANKIRTVRSGRYWWCARARSVPKSESKKLRPPKKSQSDSEFGRSYNMLSYIIIFLTGQYDTIYTSTS